MNRIPRFLTAWRARLNERHLELDQLPLDDAVHLFERYRQSLFRPHPTRPDADLAYQDGASVPQEMQFAIDCLPALRRLLAGYSRDQIVELLDVGPARAAGSNLIATLYRSPFLGCQARVDALDRDDSRSFIARFSYPLVDYRVGTIGDLSADQKWNIIYCSNVIEHLEDPRSFIASLLAHARDWVVRYAPYNEQSPMSGGHVSRIDEGTFEPFHLVSLELIETPAWRPAGQTDPKQILVVLRA